MPTEIAGFGEPVGIVATPDIDALLALGADVVVYTAKGETRPGEVVPELARILRDYGEERDARRIARAIVRARERGETQGFMKILVDAETKKILGAAILGIGGDEAIHCVLDVMYADAPYTVIQRAMHIHPTVTELIPTMLGDLKPLE